ncbi:MAG: heavy metal translocating P-type ATPase metal-binding domain-containing protein, partial [Cytophagaceae bacterium]|nr:heavy metal translocating P-type ATPase metal-binding domain-containing protein [Cytophagaceae bacterium]
MELLVKEEKNLKVKCYHCGDDCINDSVLFENKSFCCSGCKTVYEILNSNNLCTYYNINNFPGNRIKEVAGDKYAYLDNEEIINKVTDFKEGNSSRVTFFIPNIHCSSCIWLLENLQKLNQGIFRAQINFLKKELTIIFKNDSISLRHVVEILDSIGYPPQLNLGQIENKPVKKNRTLLYKLGIAGFCFGNIMLFSFPDYVSIGDLDSSFGSFFGYISLILSLPVFFYCASDYFKSSLNAIKSKTINIDLPIALGLVVVFSRSAFEIITHTGSGYLDSFSGLVFFLLIGKWYQKKTYDNLSFKRDYKSYFPVAITKINGNGKFENAPITSLKTGDRVIIRNGELIPGDGVITKGIGRIDYSFVTGESVSVTKKEGTDVFAGGRQIGEILEMVLTKEVSQSYFTSLWNQNIFKKEKKHNLSSF